jgi:acetylornithine deacetylase
VHASLISSGTEPSTIPDRCVLTIERRTLPGETVSDVEREVADLLDGCRAADPRLAAAARTVMHRPPLEPAADQGVVRALTAAHRQVRGEQAAIGGLSYWTDAAFLAARGIPTVVFGPVGEGAHADVKWVSLSSTVDCARVLVAAAERLSREPPAPAQPDV